MKQGPLGSGPGGRGLGSEGPCSLPPSTPSLHPNLRYSSITLLAPPSYVFKDSPSPFPFPILNRPS